MHQSFAAKYAARPTARFARPAGRERERRLGLHPGLAFQAATRRTVVRSSRQGLHVGGWHPVATTMAGGLRGGRICHGLQIAWAGVGRARADRQASLTPAPWRG
jgi:hypothetical protein